MSRSKPQTRYTSPKKAAQPPSDWDDFGDWLNCWAWLLKHTGEAVRNGLTTKWGAGYQRAVSDIYKEFRRLREEKE